MREFMRENSPTEVLIRKDGVSVRCWIRERNDPNWMLALR